ncbi:hypothetical protein [Flavobacterium orientale]|uniref:Uncharacterized protein n=1 Tax=Flavobacterium orientale TaxID=1756020 RepID=A0A917DDA8_9FLAO|nr:hypothetical protein [Flavobacterium orientale]GGD28739.1 hypothetical protein GCM10011343_18650 [Flavobacterium orientale]
METSTTYIGLFLILLTIFPIILLLRSQHINKSKIETILKQHNQGNSKGFDIRDQINNKIVAFSSQNKRLVLIDLNTKPEQVTFKDLNEINHCEIIRASELIENAATRKERITKVELILENTKEKSKTPFKFYDFDYEKPIQINYYRDNQLAEKWMDIIKKAI